LRTSTNQIKEKEFLNLKTVLLKESNQGRKSGGQEGKKNEKF
jgi:hypothetical protein